LQLAGTPWIKETKSGRQTDTLHTFSRLDDGSFLAFFEAPDMPFEFKAQHDYDLHTAEWLPDAERIAGAARSAGRRTGHREVAGSGGGGSRVQSLP
jgi:hypothetical protein